MKQLKLRAAQPGEAQRILDWLHANPSNDFTGDILKYQTLVTLCAYNEDGPRAYLPAHKVFVLESTALAPDITLGESAQAFRDFTKSFGLMASLQKIREMYFISRDPRVIKMAEHHEYENLSDKGFQILRIKQE